MKTKPIIEKLKFKMSAACDGNRSFWDAIFSSAYHIRDYDSLKLIKDQGGFVSREEVLEIQQACLSHLDFFKSNQDIEDANEWLKKSRNKKAKSLLRKQVTPCFVYFMRNNRNGLTKIGMTRSKPVFREDTLCSQEPEITTMFYFKGSDKDEKQLHAKFSRLRKRGEWFDLAKADLDSIKSSLKDRIIYPDWH